MKTTKIFNFSTIAATAAIASFCCLPVLATPILSADLASFTVLGATVVTNVSSSNINGNVGVWKSGSANSITGFNSSPGVAVSDTQVTGGNVHAGTASAMQAQVDLIKARNNLSSLGAGIVLTLPDLAGLTLLPGIYTVPAGITNLSGALTLDGHGNANAAWVFQMSSTLITSPNSVVNMVNAGAGAGLFWNVASSATIDTNTSFLGNIVALTSVTMNTGATDTCGRVLADEGATTLQMNSLSSTCAGSLLGSNGLNGGFDVVTTATGTQLQLLPPSVIEVGSPVTVPEPSSLILLGLGLVGLGLARRRSA